MSTLPPQPKKKMRSGQKERERERDREGWRGRKWKEPAVTYRCPS